MSVPEDLGNGRTTVSRVLFRKRDLTEFCSKLGEFCEKLSEFAFGTQIIGREELTEFSPQSSVRAKKNSLSSVFQTVLPETVFGPSPEHTKFRAWLFHTLPIHTPRSLFSIGACATTTKFLDNKI